MSASERVEENQLKAPSYVELVAMVADLKDKLSALEMRPTVSMTASESQERDVRSMEKPEIREFRVIPDLNKSVKTFSGCESVFEADDWIQTVEGMSDLNDWPFAFRLQFVRAHVEGAARNWFVVRKFETWRDWFHNLKLRLCVICRRRIDGKP